MRSRVPSARELKFVKLMQADGTSSSRQLDMATFADSCKSLFKFAAIRGIRIARLLGSFPGMRVCVPEDAYRNTEADFPFGQCSPNIPSELSRTQPLIAGIVTHKEKCLLEVRNFLPIVTSPVGHTTTWRLTSSHRPSNQALPTHVILIGDTRIGTPLAPIPAALAFVLDLSG